MLTISYVFDTLLPKDISKIAFAIAVVWLFCAFKLDSLLLATLGIVHIIFSFLVGYLFLTQVLLDLGPAMPVLAALVPFLILGIGADDLFIFMDAWRQSEATVPRSRYAAGADGDSAWRQRRLRYAYSRSAWAMFVTSLTTGVAFVQLLSSTTLGIKAMGFCAAMTVLVDYLMVISYFPCLVMWWHRDIAGLFTVFKRPLFRSAPVDRFFEQRFAPALHKHRHPVLAGFAVWILVTVIASSRLRASSEGA